jgi:hypothetical protein
MQPLGLAISGRFGRCEAGIWLDEMELTNATEEDDSVGGTGALHLRMTDGTRSPIENPAIDPVPDDPLLEPHPGEPGVHSDGTWAPLENPDDSASADPLIANG